MREAANYLLQGTMHEATFTLHSHHESTLTHFVTTHRAFWCRRVWGWNASRSGWGGGREPTVWHAASHGVRAGPGSPAWGHSGEQACAWHGCRYLASLCAHARATCTHTHAPKLYWLTASAQTCTYPSPLQSMPGEVGFLPGVSPLTLPGNSTGPGEGPGARGGGDVGGGLVGSSVGGEYSFIPRNFSLSDLTEQAEKVEGSEVLWARSVSLLSARRPVCLSRLPVTRQNTFTLILCLSAGTGRGFFLGHSPKLQPV